MDEHILKTKVAGITRGQRQELLARLRPSESVHLSKQLSRNGKFEAVAVLAGGQQLGWLKKEVAEILLPLLRQGIVFKGWTSTITRAREGHLECEIELLYQGPEVSGPGIRTRTKKAKRRPEESPEKPALPKGRGCLSVVLFLLGPPILWAFLRSVPG